MFNLNLVLVCLVVREISQQGAQDLVDNTTENNENRDKDIKV